MTMINDSLAAEVTGLDTVTCAVYVRQSEDKTGEAVAASRQTKLGLAKAREFGWDVPQWAIYEDNDTSATNGKPRPAYERMLADIKAGRVQAIVAFAPDRIYRKLADLERLIEVCDGYQVAIRTYQAGELDLSTPLGRMVARILGAVATQEGELKAQRIKASILDKRKEGIMPKAGRRMYGWNRDGSVNDEEAAVLREVARRLLTGGESVASVCRDLNEREVPTSGGGKWAITALTRVVTNPRMAGHSTYHGKIVGKGQWDAIYDEETWELLKARLASPGRGRLPRVALLPGLVVCGREGCGMTLKTGGRDVGGKRQRTYRCAHSDGHYENGCGRLSVAAEPVELVVEEAAKLALSNAKVRKRLAKLRKASAASSGTHIAQELSKLRQREAALRAAMRDPSEDLDDVREALADVRASIAEYGKQLEQHTAEPLELPETADEWPTDLQRRRRLVEVVISKVVVAPSIGGPFRKERLTIYDADGEVVPLP